MKGVHPILNARILIYLLGALFVCLLSVILPATQTDAAEDKIIVLDVRVQNELGIENANYISTRWLMDSIRLFTAHTSVVSEREASELARMRLPRSADDISPSAARTLMKSISATHILSAEIFRWDQSYGVTIRLIELPHTRKVRIERARAATVGDIPQTIEDLTRRLFAPPVKQPEVQSLPKQVRAEGDSTPVPAIPSTVRALLKEHPEMIYVPGGEFIMGNDNDIDADYFHVDPARREEVSRLMLLATEKPEHRVYAEPFLIDRHEVTNAEYKRFKASHDFPAGMADHPVTGIDWHNAKSFAEWAGKRLPTEEEWEKAARGTDGRKWPWGNVFERGKCNLGTGTAPVGSFEGDKSPYGVLDMAGNVQEWTSSDFTSYPGNTSKDISFDPSKKVVRGSFYGGNDFLARCSMRFCAFPGGRGIKAKNGDHNFIGFRCAMDVE